MRVFTLFIMMITLLANPTALFAKEASNRAMASWDNIRTVPYVEQVRIELKNGKVIKGKIERFSETGLTVSQKKNKSMDIEKKDIIKVYRYEERTGRGKKALIGAGVGAGVGLSASFASGPFVMFVAPIATVVGCGLGAVLGLTAGLGKKSVLIYQA